MSYPGLCAGLMGATSGGGRINLARVFPGCYWPLPAHCSRSVPADLPPEIRLQIVTSCAEPPDGDRWLHEIKHDGHRLVAVVTPNSLRLISRNGFDRTLLFQEPFRSLTEAGLPGLVLDGEIAVPDERGITHLDSLNEAITARRPDKLAYFAFDLVHLAGYDLRRCSIEDRKLLLHGEASSIAAAKAATG